MVYLATEKCALENCRNWSVCVLISSQNKKKYLALAGGSPGRCPWTTGGPHRLRTAALGKELHRLRFIYSLSFKITCSDLLCYMFYKHITQKESISEVK